MAQEKQNGESCFESIPSIRQILADDEVKTQSNIEWTQKSVLLVLG